LEPITLRRTSDLAVDADTLWTAVASFEGINRELMPLARMIPPAGIEALSPETVTPGQCLGRSWILLFGVIPVDYDDITLTKIDPGHGFVEESTLMTQRVWRHVRTLESIPGGTHITDEVTCVPRLAILRPIARVVFPLAFSLRHHNLRRRYGVVDSS